MYKLHSFEVSVTDILKLPSFKHSEIVSGHSGIHNTVKWTHIIESEKFIDTLSGNELILTTGIGLQNDMKSKEIFLEQLLNINVAAICIELGSVFDSVPSRIQTLSDEYNIPIIVFTKEVKFVEITQVIHRLIIENQYKKINKIYELSRKFSELSLQPNGILKILNSIYSNLNTPVVFYQYNKELFFYPPEFKITAQDCSMYVKKIKNNKVMINDKQFLVYSVQNFRGIAGYLFLKAPQQNDHDFFYSVLDHASLAISQIILRNEFIEERKLYSEDELIQDLLLGNSKNINQLDSLLPFSYKNVYYRAMLILFDRNANENELDINYNEFKLRVRIILRNIFNKFDSYPIISIKESEIILFNFIIKEVDISRNKKNHEKIINQIKENNELKQLINGELSIGVSSLLDDIVNIPKAYTESKRVIELSDCGLIDTSFYDDIGLFDLFYHFDHVHDLRNFVHTHLGKLLTSDVNDKTELLNTLEAILDANGSLVEAAKNIHVVRQTIYYRVKKLKEILEVDFMSYPFRLTLEVAVKAYRFLSLYNYANNQY